MGHKYSEDRYPIPSEDEFYQRDPDNEEEDVDNVANNGIEHEESDAMNEEQNGGRQRRRIRRHSSFDGVNMKKSKPMPKESSFFIFRQNNR